MNGKAGLRPPEPILVADLFPKILDELLQLLAALPAQAWQEPTVCAGWSVKDVTSHLLGVEVGNLSWRRDGYTSNAAISSWDELILFINDWNERWVQASRRISSRLLIDLLRLTGTQMSDYFRSLDPYAIGGAVSWAGPEPAPVWLDLAREYTERWHHQQHIRDAVGEPGLKGPRYLAPVLATFVRALPRAFRTTLAPEDTSVTLTITGESGGRWSLLCEADAWRLYAGVPDQPDAEVIIPADAAWRLFTRGLNPSAARERMVLKGDTALGATVLEMVSIIA
jgi:uncharacterized protein (TIGR03083 family)